MTYRQKKLLLVAVMVTIVVFLLTEIKVAVGAKGFYYNQNFLPPRIHQLCNDSYIGFAYNPHIDKRCRGLWTSWTNEILSTKL